MLIFYPIDFVTTPLFRRLNLKRVAPFNRYGTSTVIIFNCWIVKFILNICRNKTSIVQQQQWWWLYYNIDHWLLNVRFNCILKCTISNRVMMSFGYTAYQPSKQFQFQLVCLVVTLLPLSILSIVLTFMCSTLIKLFTGLCIRCLYLL